MNKQIKNPPIIAEWLLTAIANQKDNQAIIGDFEEEYYQIAETRGTTFAQLWYWSIIIISLPSFFINNFFWSTAMFNNYIKTAFRNIKNSKIYSIINISGLAIGMACAIFILLWVQDELSYDGFHENKDNIYRVATKFINDGNTFYGGQTSPPVAQYLKTNFPEIQKSTAVCGSWLTGNSRNIIKYGENSFYTDNLVLTDPSFFEIFCGHWD